MSEVGWMREALQPLLESSCMAWSGRAGAAPPALLWTAPADRLPRALRQQHSSKLWYAKSSGWH